MGLKCSLLYQELTQTELAAIVQKHFATAVFKATRLEGGMFNTTYRMEAAGAAYVLRMGPINRHLLLPFERRLMEGETEFYRQCRAAGLPVSEVVALDNSRNIVDRDYMIVRFVESVGMYALPENSEAWNAVMENVGRFVKCMHGIEGPCFARLGDAVAGRGFARWSEYIFHELDEVMDCYAKVDLYTAEERAQIDAIFRESAALLDEVTVPRLIHADIWHGNVLVKPDGSNDIAAVIDGDRALWGDVDFDLQKRWLHHEHFWRGYGNEQYVAPERERRRLLYRLLMCLIDGYVWKYEYQMPENAQRCHDGAMALLRQLREEA